MNNTLHEISKLSHPFNPGTRSLPRPERRTTEEKLTRLEGTEDVGPVRKRFGHDLTVDEDHAEEDGVEEDPADFPVESRLPLQHELDVPDEVGEAVDPHDRHELQDHEEDDGHALQERGERRV